MPTSHCLGAVSAKHEVDNVASCCNVGGQGSPTTLFHQGRSITIHDGQMIMAFNVECNKLKRYDKSFINSYCLCLEYVAGVVTRVVGRWYNTCERECLLRQTEVHLSAKPTLIATTSRWTKRNLRLPERVSGAWVDDTGQVEPSWTWAGAYSAMLLWISCFSSSFGWWGLTTSQWLIRLKTQKRFTGSKIGAIFWQITSRVTTKNLKSGNKGILRKSSWMRKSEKEGPNLKFPRCPIFNFFCDDSWGNLPKNGTNLRPGEFFLGFQPYKSLWS